MATALSPAAFESQLEVATARLERLAEGAARVSEMAEGAARITGQTAEAVVTVRRQSRRTLGIALAVVAVVIGAVVIVKLVRRRRRTVEDTADHSPTG